MYENELEDIIEAVNEMKAQKRAQDLAVQQEGAVNANGAEAEAQASQDALSPASFTPDPIASGALNSTSAPDIASSNAQNFTSLDTKNSTSRFVPSDALNSALDRYRSGSMASKSSAPSSVEFAADATLKKSAAKDENFTFSSEENFKNSDLTGGQNSAASASLNGENFNTQVINWSKTRDKLSIVDDQISAPTYSKDLAEFSWKLIQTEKYGLYHITNNGIASKYEQAKYVLEKIGWKGILETAKTKDFNLPAKRPYFSKLSSEKVEKLLGKKIPDWKNGIDRYLEEMGIIKK